MRLANMDTTPICPNCGKLLAPNAPKGLCPECLLKAELHTATTAGGGPGFIPPQVADLAALFPQLEIVELIGKGGMGAVYKARQPKLNRFVALKILAPERSADPKFAERFLREAQALARLSHPNIVTVHDFRQSSTGVPPAPASHPLYYLLMEYADGASLRELLKERRVKLQAALAIVPPSFEA